MNECLHHKLYQAWVVSCVLVCISVLTTEPPDNKFSTNIHKTHEYQDGKAFYKQNGSYTLNPLCCNF